MTVPAQTPVSTHVGNGVTTTFAYAFKLLDQADIEVSVDGVVKTLTTDYSVTGVGVDAGGTIVFVSAPASLADIALVRNVTVQRLTDYQYSGDFQSPTVNRDFDRVVMMVQDSGVNVANAIRLPYGDASSGVLPNAADRALKALAFDADGDPVVVAGAGDATALGAALLSTTASTGGALVGFDSANTYPASSVGLALKTAAVFDADVANLTDAAKGSALLGYKPSFAGAVGRTLSAKLADTVSAQDFGLSPSNTGAQNNTAMAAAIAYAIAQGGLTLFIPRGVYDFASSIDLTGANRLRITGEGIDATTLRITHATANFITQSADSFYQTLDNLTLTSSVTRTAGSMFHTGGFWKRGLLFRVKIEKHFHGVNLFQFEHCSLMEVNIVTPTGNGDAIIAGNAAATNQGANLNLVTVFIRGNDETNPVAAAVGRCGIRAFDIQAIYGINVDLSIFTDQAMVIEPITAAENFFFTSCYFDATVGGDNVQVKGAGLKNRFQFSNCWFATAGRYGAGAANQAGVNFNNAGTYTDWKFAGCQFVGTSGPGMIVSTAQADITLSGCSFNNCGQNTTLPTSIYVVPGAAQTKGMVISGCKFIPFGTSTSDLNFANTNCDANVITGCELLRGITYTGGAKFGAVEGNSDPNTSNTIASAATLQVATTKKFYTITGATNVGGLFRTYPGHMVTLVATGVFTWQNGGALALAGGVNYTTAAGSSLTIICRPDGTWGEVTRHA